MHLHHLHQFDDVHYDTAVHDDYVPHRHVWLGNNHFDTVTDCDDDHPFGRDDDCHADDHQLATPGNDHQHPGYDIRWADHHSRTGPTPTT